MRCHLLVSHLWCVLIPACLSMAGCSDFGGEPVEAAVVQPATPSPPIEPLYPIPSDEQLQWQNSEMAMFIHFGMNTFTGADWGDGKEDPSQFAPIDLDVAQWVAVAREIGFSSIILTVKHHDGFCLWPSKYTTHTVARSPFRGGTGDVVRELADACRAAGVKFGIYISPWDQHEPTFGTGSYNAFFNAQLTELLTGYGDIAEVWFDGAIGKGIQAPPYDWNLFFSTIRRLQPHAVIAEMGPDIRWIGNENGVGKETEWSVQPQRYTFQSVSGNGTVWYPSESDVSLRTAWFHHRYENGNLKPVDILTSIYFRTVGRNSNLLLNVSPDIYGRIPESDVERLREWKARLSGIFSRDIFRGRSITASSVRDGRPEFAADKCIDGDRSTFWAASRDSLRADLTIRFSSSERINIVRLEEAIEYGQRVASFALYAESDGAWLPCFQGSTIGRSRIVIFPAVAASAMKIVINTSLAAPTLRTVQGYYSPLIIP